ncbi:MAG: hypothetical protein HGA53_07470 [Anaerolineaceae bacterium]|nr:hypothetical protein [Anaerolineaceae bacterium]
MTKKQKRSTNSVVTSSTPVAARPAASSSRASNATVEFKPDYSQTKKDLKRIGILAGTFVSLLVILSFFLR